MPVGLIAAGVIALAPRRLERAAQGCVAGLRDGLIDALMLAASAVTPRPGVRNVRSSIASWLPWKSSLRAVAESV